jgi:fimbrial isopeptide formation D2 family protein/LPXTG-motif cell wall-anchored protein
MKQIKKMMALVLAMVMTLAMGITVFADPAQEPEEPAAATYSITVTNDNTAMSIIGKTYTAYKLFDVTYDGTNYAYSIKTDNPFYSGAAKAAVLDTYFDFTDTSDATVKTVTVKTAKQDATTKTLSADDVRKLADALQPYATGTGAGSAQATAETVTINLDEAGYYIVTGTVKPTDPANSDKEVVSAVILDNADPTAEVKPKASVPTLNKKITKVDNATTDLLDDKGKAAVAKVGSVVSYELDSVVPDLTGYSDYTFTFEDKLTGGLDYVKDSFALTIKGATENIAPTFAADKKSFTLTIPYDTLSKAAYTKGDAIVLTYNCTVNDSALTYDFENNTADLVYSKSPYDTTTNKTPEKKTYVIDLNLDVDKIDGSNSSKHLDGAEFKLYRTAADGTTKEYYIWDTTNNKVTWGTEANADVFTTGTTGKLSQQVRGLDKGNYFLVETKAPKGYNLMKDPVAVVINVEEDANGEKVTYSATYGEEDATMTNGEVNLTAATQSSGKQPVATGAIENNSGAELPSTGGIGTTIFYVIGAILVLGAGILLVTRRRMNAN